MKARKGRNRTGTLYRRWKGGRYSIDDPTAKGKGTIYLRYTVGSKAVVISLKTADVGEAKKKQAEIMKPIELASEVEVLEQAELRLKRAVGAQQEEWKKDNPPLKLTDAWAAYLKAQNRPRSGQKTLNGYASRYKQFREWIQSAFPEAVYMKDVGVREAEAYAEHLVEQKLSPSTYNQILNVLALMWGVLFEKAHAKDNPFAWDRKTRKGIQRRSIKAEAYQRKKRALTVEEVEAVLKKAKGDYRTLIIILVCTGQRLVDGLKLEWKAVNFDRNVITLVPKKTSKRSGKAVYIPLLPQLRQELEGRKQRGRYVMSHLVEQYDRDSSSVSKNIKEIFDDAKIQTAKDTELETGRVITDVGAHSLRHTFVTVARAAGLPDPFIRQITGHSSQEMVDHYTQFSEEMVAALAGKLLGTAGTQKGLPAPSKALPAPFSETVKDPTFLWAQTKVSGIKCLVSRIKGDQNEKMKELLLKALGELEAFLKAPHPPASQTVDA